MRDTDIIVIGSGASALATLYTARELGLSAMAVDSAYVDGGYLQTIDTPYTIQKAPFFIYRNELNFFSSLGIDAECLDVEVKLIKEGDYRKKTLGFSGLDVQKNWFTEWINTGTLCLKPFLFKELKKALGFQEDRPIHVVSNVRRIDMRRKVVALTIGDIVKYNRLIYTWPLEILPRYIYPEDTRKRVAEIIEGLGLDYTSIYILTSALRNRRQDRGIEIYVHATKASRMHTAILVNTDDCAVLYAITSYSKEYPLLPGIYEKMISELKRYRIAKKHDMVKSYSINIVYGLINKVNQNTLRELEQYLQEHDIYIFGRLAQWQEGSIKDIIEKHIAYTHLR